MKVLCLWKDDEGYELSLRTAFLYMGHSHALSRLVSCPSALQAGTVHSHTHAHTTQLFDLHLLIGSYLLNQLPVLFFLMLKLYYCLWQMLKGCIFRASSIGTCVFIVFQTTRATFSYFLTNK